MKVSSLIAVLSNFEAAAAAASGSGAAGTFKEFRQLFLGHDEDNVAPFLNTLIKQRDIHGRRTNTPPLAHLREVLTKLEACLRSAEGKKGADDIAKLVELIGGCGQASVDAFVSEARVWLAEATQPKPKSKSARAPRKSSTAPMVEVLSLNEYANRLKQAARDNPQFDELVERLRGDKKVKKADMREIAQLFLGYEIAKKKGREDALTAIVERQQVDARQDARGSLLDRLKSW
jgi:hypothetical protein